MNMITWFFENFCECIRGLTGTPPTPLNVAALCHLTAVLIFLPYPDRDARWKQKGRQEDFNIALRSHTICPFHEQADGRGGNTSLHYKQTPAYFKVTCKSRHLQGSSQLQILWNLLILDSKWLHSFRQDYVSKALQAVPDFDSPCDR